MNASLATLIYACGIAGLFYLDRDSSVRTSKALWLPVIYLWVDASRPISLWLGTPPPPGANVQLDGSPVDRAFYLVLLIAALVVLIQRGSRALKFVNANWPILAYFFFCLVSVIWSDYPDVAFKRWTKAIGDIAMILVVVTDEQPVAALRRLFSRLGFILLPASLLLIKYYPALGRYYGVWDGAQINTGVTLDKNLLGVITFVLSLGAAWRVLGLLRSAKDLPDRRRHLIAQGTLLAFGIYLLSLANSATSIVSFSLGAGLLLATSLQYVRRHAAAVHVLVLSLIIIASSVMLLGGGADVTQALGRQSNLTGRTDIWADVIPMAPNPLVGAGFESFWLNPNVHQKLAALIPGLPLNEAHDGYIEMYLELGWVGLILIGLVLIDGYRRSVNAFRRDPALGGLFIAYIVAAVVYNVTEAGFRMMHPMWVFLLLAVVEASVIAAGVTSTAPKRQAAPADLSLQVPASDAPAASSQQAYSSLKVAR